MLLVHLEERSENIILSLGGGGTVGESHLEHKNFSQFLDKG